MPLNITYSVLNVNYEAYNNSVIALVQRFIIVWTNSCILTHKFAEINAAVGPYKNKSLNSCDSLNYYIRGKKGATFSNRG